MAVDAGDEHERLRMSLKSRGAMVCCVTTSESVAN
jgi:hypothetical protein